MTYQVRTKPQGSFTDFLVVRDDELSGIKRDSMTEAAWLMYILNHTPEDVLRDARTYGVKEAIKYLNRKREVA